jgi:hypothetical protein
MSELRTLVEVALRRLSCQVEAVQENLLHIAIPADSSLRQTLDVSETAYLALVQFADDELAGLDPVRHLIPGSIYLDRFIGSLTEHGAVGDVTLPAIYDCPPENSVETFLVEAVPSVSGWKIARDEILVHRCVTFHFVVDLFAIESNKTLVSITFDFDGGRLISNPDTGRLLDAEPAVVEIADTELKAATGTVLENVKMQACRQIESYAE